MHNAMITLYEGNIDLPGSQDRHCYKQHQHIARELDKRGAHYSDAQFLALGQGQGLMTRTLKPVEGLSERIISIEHGMSVRLFVRISASFSKSKRTQSPIIPMKTFEQKLNDRLARFWEESGVEPINAQRLTTSRQKTSAQKSSDTKSYFKFYYDHILIGQISDCEKFAHILKNGFGGGRAYGLGMVVPLKLGDQ